MIRTSSAPACSTEGSLFGSVDVLAAALSTIEGWPRGKLILLEFAGSLVSEERLPGDISPLD